MSSFTRNTRRANSTQRLRALGAGLALTVVSGAALAHGAHQFVFTAYSDAAGGADVLTGRYRAALEELKSHPGDVDFGPSLTNTNRCIAYSMTLQWQEARAACDAAVHAANDQRKLTPAWSSWERMSDEDYLAVAYANRAVMEWMSDDYAAARRDLAAAHELSPQADFVARNLAALKTHDAVAQTNARRKVARAGAPAPKS
jgi:tetratricopeptide (TPR) repeat protein